MTESAVFNQIFFHIVNGLIFAGIVYYAFAYMFKPATNKRWILLAFAAYVAISSLLFFIYGNIWVNVIFTIMSLFVISFLFVGNVSAKLVFTFFIYTMLVVSEGISFFSLSSIYPEIQHLQSVGRAVSNVILLLLLYISMLLFHNLINKKAGYKHFKVPNIYTVAFLVILAGVILLNLLIISATVSEIGTNLTQVIVAQFIVLVVMFLIIWLYNTMLDYLDTLEKSSLKDQMLERWEVQYKAVMNSQKALAKTKHDLRLHFLTMDDYLKKDEIAKAQEYIADKIGSFDYIIATDNMPIDTILNYYQQRVKEILDIDLETELIIPANMVLDATNVVMILGNALENAIEACGRVAKPERYIQIKAIITAQNELMITITNPYAITPIIDKEGNLLTIKPDKNNHGLGLASAREILSEESGQIYVEYADSVFRFMLFLYDVRRESKKNVAN